MRRVVDHGHGAACEAQFRGDELSSDRRNDAFAICDSLVVRFPEPEPQLDRQALDLLKPSRVENVNVLFKSGARAELQVSLPREFRLADNYDAYSENFSYATEPAAGVVLTTSYTSDHGYRGPFDRSDCKRWNGVFASERFEDSMIMTCTTKDNVNVQRVVRTPPDEFKCVVWIDRANPSPLPQAVMEQQTKDGVAICKSLKVLRYVPAATSSNTGR